MSRNRYPWVALYVLLTLLWVVLDRYEPFRSHFALTMLGSGLSAVVGGVIVYRVRRTKNGGSAT